MRLIDADVLKQHIDKLPALPDGNFAGNHSALKALINMQPTIEPSTNCSGIPNNSDTINRQVAIDRFNVIRPVDPKKDEYTKGIDVGIAMCIVAVKDQPTIQPEPQWIPVEKELPEPRIDVWVNSDLGQMVGYYDEMVNLWYGRDYLELIVNAWMPLPEAYKPNK
jgi:hypothetical protein